MKKKDKVVEAAAVGFRKKDLKPADVVRILSSLDEVQQEQLRSSITRSAQTRLASASKTVRNSQLFRARSLISLLTTLLLGEAEGDAVGEFLEQRTHVKGVSEQALKLMDVLYVALGLKAADE